ncbi:substrate-binding periplasmic protein [Litorilituus lipolyticus]|uniref:Transporter substrate-binding domain-containing protein n=1 Tax=Litorilituus lipolyticus TaxID=2491017 RepID=A0A502L5T8_9GAMM|nr:transporter substrate-binding domain-containing protein [Litorilituus lipolyticus]TPH19308.1 transporter substrate-binding domain-containing protein [Litorilituus lipolyticus]
MLKRLFMLSIFACLYSISFGTLAQTIAVVTEDAPSLQYQKASGEMAGPAANLVEKVLNESGFNFDTRVLPWARAYKEAKQVPNTLIYSMVRTPEREDNFHWIGIISKPQYYLFALKSKDIPLAKPLIEYHQYRVGTVLNSANHLALKNQGFDSLVPVATAKQVFMLLTKKRVELITANLTAFDEICQHNSKQCDDIEAIGPISALNDRALYFAMNKNSDASVVQTLRETYQKLLTDKAINIF